MVACAKCRGSGKETYYHDSNSDAPSNWYRCTCFDCGGTGQDREKSLEQALRDILMGFHPDENGVEWINVHLDGASEPSTPGQVVALMGVSLFAARKLLEELTTGEQG
tara:strand:- start:164 stop:487 length:324 start_codon:yes stop_codon:yes gene_type:complete